MAILRFLAILTVIFAISPEPARAADKVDYGSLKVSDTMRELEIPAFSDYPVPVDSPAGGMAPAIDLTSYPFTAKHAEALRAGFREKSDLAGHYVVIRTGCEDVCANSASQGDGGHVSVYIEGQAAGCRTGHCSAYWIADKLTGKIIGVVSAAHGVEYRPDSLLIFTDPFTPYMGKRHRDLPADFDPAVHKVEDGKVVLRSAYTLMGTGEN